MVLLLPVTACPSPPIIIISMSGAAAASAQPGSHHGCIAEGDYPRAAAAQQDPNREQCSIASPLTFTSYCFLLLLLLLLLPLLLLLLLLLLHWLSDVCHDVC